MASPVAQFELKSYGPQIEVGGIDLSFTNSAAMMVVAIVGIVGLAQGGKEEGKRKGRSSKEEKEEGQKGKRTAS